MKYTAKLTLFVSCLSLICFSSSITSSAKPSLIYNNVIEKKSVVTENTSNTLKILNAEDYIYEQGSPNDPISIVDQFVAEYKAKTGKDITIVYDTYDTNESMLTELKTGKTQYDLICASDYTLQKMIVEDLVIKFDDSEVNNYVDYSSRYLTGKLNDIKIKGETGIVNSYVKGYMWGTLGLLYNPEYRKFSEQTKQEVRKDMSSWSSLWNEKYKNTISIKDSIRDTYAVGILEAFKPELEVLAANYAKDKDAVKYNKEFTELFNKCDTLTINRVVSTLLELKKNIYGFEIDSGKDDITKGLIGINLAWSGDAVYAIEEAEKVGLTLEYKIPDIGSNIWFDGWAMPKGANATVAQAFVNFLSDPTNAIQNVEATGYTSFIAGDQMLDYVKDSYDVSANPIGETIYNRDLTYFFSESLTKYTEADCAIKLNEENRYFDAAYPSVEQLPHLGVMDDFGENLPNILAMWEYLKATQIPFYVYIIVLSAAITGIGILVFIKVRKNMQLKRRKERRKEIV
ncbi:MAG: extracellular solute-binding protein [Bacilli bacterium]